MAKIPTTNQRLARGLVLGAAACLAGGTFPGSAGARLLHVPSQYGYIQLAINNSVSGDTVLLSPGTYGQSGNRDLDFGGRNIVLTSSGTAVNTIIDCTRQGRGFFFHHTETPAARIEKITIRNGYLSNGNGGGVCCSSASPTISQCTISNCEARDGGGLYLIDFSGIVDQCVIAGNTASVGAGGISEYYSGSVTISNCVITGNTHRGVSFGWPGPDVLRGCTITANPDGGIATGTSLYIDKCILWGNCGSEGHELTAENEDTYFTCSDVDSTGVLALYGANAHYDSNSIFIDPFFCGPVPCSQTSAGTWTLSGNSPCLVQHSPCGRQIGALGQGCGPWVPTGACCLAGGVCLIQEEPSCLQQQGTFVGDQIPCFPNPCWPTSSVTLPSALAPSETSVFPNPSNGQVLIRYRLATAAAVTLEIFDASGSLVRRLTKGPQSAGAQAIQWDGRDDRGGNVPSGVFLTRIRTPAGVQVGRVSLVR